MNRDVSFTITQVKIRRKKERCDSRKEWRHIPKNSDKYPFFAYSRINNGFLVRKLTQTKKPFIIKEC